LVPVRELISIGPGMIARQVWHLQRDRVCPRFASTTIRCHHWPKMVRSIDIWRWPNPRTVWC